MSHSVDCALQNNKKRGILLDTWARNFRYLLRTQRKTKDNRKMMKRCDPPGFLSDYLIGQLNYIQYSEAGSYLAPLQILHKLEHVFNEIINIQFKDNCMIKTVNRRKKQEIL